MARAENLPPGIQRLQSLSLRARFRPTGRQMLSEVFPLHEDTAEARRSQLRDAEAWIAQTRRAVESGVHVDTSAARNLTVGDCLRKYRDAGLKGKPSNTRKDKNRIEAILLDDIASLSVLRLRTTSLANYRDELLKRGLAKKGQSPARTTVGNKLQLISRALNYVREVVDGIPVVEFPSLPQASPGRERRVSEQELGRLLEAGEAIDPILPLVVRFAIATALRKDRVLTCAVSNIMRVTPSAEMIAFPKVPGIRAKTVGKVPVTREVRAIVAAAEELTQPSRDDAIFGLDEYRFDYLWRRMLHNAQIKDLHFHDLRHEATSKLFEAGLTTAEVMSITGHTTKEMVDRYSHYSSVLVLKKLEKGLDTEALRHELATLMQAYVVAGGSADELVSMAQELTAVAHAT